MTWKPNSQLADMMIAAEREASDTALVEQYAAGPGSRFGQGEIAALLAFVRHVRQDLGPAANIVEVKIEPERGNDKHIVYYTLPKNPAEQSLAAENPVLGMNPAVSQSAAAVPAAGRAPAPRRQASVPGGVSRSAVPAVAGPAEPSRAPVPPGVASSAGGGSVASSRPSRPSG
jgi:hypothetical protein